MDAGYGKSWFRKQEYALELRRSILHYHAERYQVGCFVVMTTHCHLIIRPSENLKLEDEVGAIKSVVSRFINKHESTSGSLWQQESYDRIIRDEEHLYRVVQYIGANPAKAGIPEPDWYRGSIRTGMVWAGVLKRRLERGRSGRARGHATFA